MPKKWISRKSSMAMDFEALDKEYQEDFRSRHWTRVGQEAYDFDIKIRKINIPWQVRGIYTDKQIDEKYQEYATDALETFKADLKHDYEWISAVFQEGRSGGWLVVVTRDEPAFIDGIRMGYVRKRIRDLREIEEKVKIAKKNFVAMMEDSNFWEIGPRDWSPRWKNK